LLESLGQRRSLGLAHGTAARLFHHIGRYPDADAAYRAALHNARAVDDTVLEGLLSAHLGALCADRGQLEVAADYLDRADALLMKRMPETLRIAAIVSRGNLQFARGEDPFSLLERSEHETRSVDVRWAVRLLERRRPLA
jgi:tetratricopeptide (TPR) repeat protein